MSYTYHQLVAHTSSAGNPISFSVTTQKPDTVLVLMLKVAGATNRAGGAPSLNGVSFTQASTTQKAAASPEASAELWYLLNPHDFFPPGTYTLTIPNTGALTVFYGVDAGSASGGGGRSQLDGEAGANGTSTNPAPGSITTITDGCIGFAVVATGAQSWSPSAQTGTAINNTDDGAHGTGRQYHLQSTLGTVDLGWTFGTSDDWGAVAAYFREVPPVSFNNYLGWDAAAGSVTEKIR